MPNFIPEFSGYSGQGAFRYWCQKVLPLVYDDSLSYYELLNKMVVYLNNTIEDVAKAEGNIDSLLTAYTQLQGYVNDYFDNLDVQEEINTKLDEMAESGELSDLLEPFIPNLVTSWLTENVIIPEGGAVTLDPTLTSAVQAAPAKTVGDEFKKTVMSSNIYLTHSDLDDYTTANSFPMNKIVCISSDVLSTDISDLPLYGAVSYVITMSWGEDTTSRIQIFINPNHLYTRVRILTVWQDWIESANALDVLKYQSMDLTQYSTIAEIPENTSYIVTNSFSDIPEGVTGGVLLSMQYSPNYKVQILLSLSNTPYGIFYRTVNITDSSVNTWKELYTTENYLTASSVNLQHSNLQGFTSIDDLLPNKIYGIGSDVTTGDITNLPVYDVFAYIITFAFNLSDTRSGVQIYINSDKTFIRRKRLNVWSEWKEKANASEVEAEINQSVQGSLIFLNANSMSGYTAISEFDNNRIYVISSDVDKTKLSDIPFTGEIGYALTLNYDTDVTNTGFQIYITSTGYAVRRKRLGVYSDWSYKANFNDLLDNNLFDIYTLTPNYGSGSGICTETEVDYPNIRNKKGYKITISASDAAKFGYRAPSTVKLFNGFTYELSFWAKGTGKLQTVLQYYINEYNLTEEWEKYTYRFTATYTETAFLFVYNMSVNSEVEFTDIKLKLITESQLEKDLQHKVIIPLVYNDGSLSPSAGTEGASNIRTRTYGFMNIPDSVDDILTVYLPEGWKMVGREYATAGSSQYIGPIEYRGYRGWFRGLCKIPIKKDRYYRFLFGKEVTNEGVTTDANITIADMGNSGIEISYMSATPKKDVRILCIGNSHTNQGIQYLRSILHDNGYNAVVGNYFWGGDAATLATQYGALLHDVRNIETGSVYPETGGTVKIKEYCNEGIYDDNTKTLTDLVRAQKWDYVIFQQTSTGSYDYDTYFIGDDTNPNDNTFTINKFENLLMSSYCINNSNLKFGIVAVHAWASTSVGTPITPAQQYTGIQEVTPEVAFNMNRCDFIVNEGLAINEARKNPYLNTTGTDDELTRDKNHLANGIPTFISSLTYALPIMGNSGVDNAVMPYDTENMKNKYLEYLAKKVALIANNDIKLTPYTPIE